MTTLQVVETKRRFKGRAAQVGVARLRACLGVACSFFFGTIGGISRGDDAKEAAPPARSTIHALAHLEPRSGLVTVGARPGARILKIEVNEGDVVMAGDMLATLEGNAQAKLQLNLAVAEKTRALEKRARSRARITLERTLTDKTIDLNRKALTTQVETLRKKNATAQALHTGMSAVGGVAKLTPKDQIELEAALYLLQMQTIKSELELNELELRKGQLADQRKLEDRELADSGLDDQMLDYQIEIARAALDQSFVAAPMGGTILSVDAHAGEISTGPLISMGDLTSIIARAEVDQADVGKIRVGDVARVIVIDDAVVGKVARIGSLVGFNRLRSIDPRATQDLRVVHATIVLDRPEHAAKFIGMQVDVAFEPSSGIVPIAPKSTSP